MKPLKNLSLLFILLSCFVASATVITVDNKVNAGAEYSSLSSAITNAMAGDTILVAGSATSYGNITIPKKLIIIGNGYRINASNIWDAITTVGTITFDASLTDPSDSYIAGLKASTIYLDDATTGVLVERCNTGSIYSADNAIFEIRNCIVDGYLWFLNDAPLTATVNNCILLYGIYAYNPTTTVLINHCLFLNNTMAYSQLKYAMIQNSIIYLQSTANAQFTNFSNNISFAGTTGVETSFDTGGDNTGGGNFEDQDPMFTTVTTGDFSYNDDYHLTGGPGVNGALDGSNIGIYGGDYPFPVGGTGSYLMAAPPQIPYIYNMNIENPSVAEDGTLNVNVKAAKRD